MNEDEWSGLRLEGQVKPGPEEYSGYGREFGFYSKCSRKPLEVSKSKRGGF